MEGITFHTRDWRDLLKRDAGYRSAREDEILPEESSMEMVEYRYACAKCGYE